MRQAGRVDKMCARLPSPSPFLSLGRSSTKEGISFLGQLLANKLTKMVEKVFLVRLVLDCCFSGSALRTGDVYDTNIRSIDSDWWRLAIQLVTLSYLRADRLKGTKTRVNRRQRTQMSPQSLPHWSIIRDANMPC